MALLLQKAMYIEGVCPTIAIIVTVAGIKKMDTSRI
jgi:hypothetical protein